MKQKFNEGDRVEIVALKNPGYAYSVGDKGTWDARLGKASPDEERWEQPWMDPMFYTFKLVEEEFKEGARVEVVEVFGLFRRANKGAIVRWEERGDYVNIEGGPRIHKDNYEFKLVEEEFEVGERVRIVEDNIGGEYSGEKGTIISVISNYAYPYLISCEKDGIKIYCKVEKLKEDKMTKYEELKRRIEALDDGWNKSCDDILMELKDLHEEYALYIPLDNNGYIYLVDRGSANTHKQGFHYATQCEKMVALRQALHYLLDHSSLKVKDKKQQKIGDLKEDIRKITERIKKIEDE